MRYPPGQNTEELLNAIRRFESGLYEQASNQFLAILQKHPENRDALYSLRLVERRLARNTTLPAPALIWQFDTLMRGPV